jgi:glycosyltransferase involved in cell wall biosynthesis
MEVTVTLEHRFKTLPDGSVWSFALYLDDFWQSLLEVFERVRVVSRVMKVEEVGDSWQRVDGEEVGFAPFPYYHGPWQYLLKARAVRRALRRTVESAEALILYTPSQIAISLEPFLLAGHRPYGIKVEGDPYDVFAPHSMRHPLRPFFRWWFTRHQRKLCANASVAGYVSRRILDERYPAGPEVPKFCYADMELPDDAFVRESRVIHRSRREFTILYLGTLDQLYKRPDLLISAVGACAKRGFDLRLIIVGDGRKRGYLESLAANTGISHRVAFLGQVSRVELRKIMDSADLFLLPSSAEGFGRVLVEAMARAMPCIGSRVGGILELLPGEDCVLPNDLRSLENKIIEVLTDPERMAAMSARNLQKAKEYHNSVSHSIRKQFYAAVRERTEAWLRAKKG